MYIFVNIWVWEDIMNFNQMQMQRVMKPRDTSTLLMRVGDIVVHTAFDYYRQHVITPLVHPIIFFLD